MRFYLGCVCLLTSLVPLCVQADITSMLNSTPSQQVMHVATPAHKASSKHKVSTDADQLAKVRAIMARDKRIQLAKRTQANMSQDVGEGRDSTNTTQVTHTEGVASFAQSSARNSQGSRALQNQLTSLNQEMLMLQQRTDMKIENLSGQLQVSEQKSNRMAKALELLNTEVSTLVKAQASKPAANSTEPAANSYGSDWFALFSQYGYWFLGVLVLVLISFALYFQMNSKRLKSAATPEGGQQNEYDFLGSQEGVAAKLDLARSYLAMEDFDQMRQVLSEVMEQGDEEQKEQASQLLNKIEK